ncbi:MAG: hypothetical protein ACXADW_22590, partial [Candidatus Hodarchaeales archaeon]
RKYLDNPSLSIQRIQKDIEHGELIVTEQLGSLDKKKLEESLDWYLGSHEDRLRRSWVTGGESKGFPQR